MGTPACHGVEEVKSGEPAVVETLGAVACDGVVLHGVLDKGFHFRGRWEPGELVGGDGLEFQGAVRKILQMVTHRGDPGASIDYDHAIVGCLRGMAVSSGDRPKFLE